MSRFSPEATVVIGVLGLVLMTVLLIQNPGLDTPALIIIIVLFVIVAAMLIHALVQVSRKHQYDSEKNRINALALIAGVLGIIAIIPVDALAWWRADVVTSYDDSYVNYITAFAQFYKFNLLDSEHYLISLDNMFLAVGVLAILGSAILILAGVRTAKVPTILGALILIIAPILFMIAQNGNVILRDFTNLYNRSLLFGTDQIILWDLGGNTNWYLGIGLWLGLFAGALGFLALLKTK